MAELSIAACERLLKKAGAGRVSKQAAEELALVLEDLAVEIGKQAAAMANHAKRKTIKAEDVKLASKV